MTSVNRMIAAVIWLVCCASSEAVSATMAAVRPLMALARSASAMLSNTALDLLRKSGELFS